MIVCGIDLSEGCVVAKRGDNIYHRKDGRWEGRFVKGRAEGRTRFGYVFGKTYREAKEKLAVAQYEWQAQTKAAEQNRATFRAISESWMSDSESYLKASTISKYRDYLRLYLLPKFGNFNMDDIKSADVSAFCFGLLSNGGSERQGLSTKTVVEIYRVIKHLRKYALSRDYAVGFSGDCLTIKQKQKTMRVFSPQEQKCLSAYLLDHLTPDNLGILLCLFTGIRIGELCALRWDNISLHEQKLHICKTMQRVRVANNRRTQVVTTSPKSECAVRDIPLPDWICKFLCEAYQEGAFLLTGHAQKFIEPRTMQNRFKAVLAACGIADANFHALRHTFATRCVEAGFDAKCLSEILGHASVNITLNRYVHPTMALKREYMAKLVAA